MTDQSPPQSILLNATHNASNGHVELSPKVKWIKANLNGSGYYRVQYPDEMWLQLITQLKADHTIFSSTDRAQLLDDAFSLCRAGILEYKIPLDMATYLVKEESYIVWLTALSHLSTWVELLQETSGREHLNRFILNLIGPIYSKLAWEDTGDHVERLLRQRILRAAIEAGHKEAIEEAKGQFQKLKENQTHVSANLQDLVYSVGIKTGGEDDWQWCYNKYKTTNIPSDRSTLLKALGDSRNIFTLQSYLDMTLNKTLVRGQDFHSVMSSVASNPVGTLLSWRHLQRHWDSIFDMFHSGSFTMGHIIKSITRHFSTQFDYVQVKHFFSDKDVGAGKLALRQTMEEIQVSIEFRKRCEQQIIMWLQEKLPNDSVMS